MIDNATEPQIHTSISTIFVIKNGGFMMLFLDTFFNLEFTVQSGEISCLVVVRNLCLDRYI